jgi:uncharacterized protein
VSGENLEFTTAPFDEDVLLVGIPDLRLVASLTSQNLDLIANVYDEAPDGTRRELSQFAINPALRNSMSAPDVVVPGQAYTMRHRAGRWRTTCPQGHSLVLRVTTTDSDKYGFNTEDLRVGVHTGPLGTSLTLPVIADGVLYDDPLAE